MENKETAVEWLWKLVLDKEFYIKDFEQAKQMEKQQMIEFAKGFWYYGNGADAPPCYNEDVEKYYNKTYKK
jgi:hypothetical protein